MIAGAQAIRLNLVKDQVVAVVKQQLQDLSVTFSQIYKVQEDTGVMQSEQRRPE
jgi:hypothetical protein